MERFLFGLVTYTKRSCGSEGSLAADFRASNSTADSCEAVCLVKVADDAGIERPEPIYRIRIREQFSNGVSLS